MISSYFTKPEAQNPQLCAFLAILDTMKAIFSKNKHTNKKEPSYEVAFIYMKPMTPKKCMFMAISLTDTLHVELEPLCSA